MRMLIVSLAYLYVIGIVAVVSIADGHIASGIFTFLFAGVLPGFIVIRIQLMKRRAIRAKYLAAQQAEAEVTPPTEQA
ncbi:hypothetical protein [Chitinimonas sp.]|uniref:hypothetical protein n=1 Tax=Chitinimonas sp. TaxID=1934313 RepID=UPI002F94009F